MDHTKRAMSAKRREMTPGIAGWPALTAAPRCRPPAGDGPPPELRLADIVRAGRSIGMLDLSLNAVAAELGVGVTELHRHVDGRWGLERAVGESLVADLALTDDPGHDLERHLVHFATQLRNHIAANPGLGRYLQVLFPRGPEGDALLGRARAALVRRGYEPAAAVVVATAVATLAIGIAAGEESAVTAMRDSGYYRELGADWRAAYGDGRAGAGHAPPRDLPPERSFVLLITAAVRGLVDAAPPGRPVDDIVTDLIERGDLFAGKAA